MPRWMPRLLMSSAELDGLKRQWGEAGRRAYDQAIRTGRQVLARTESEIEALGRAQLEQEKLQRAQADAVRDAAGRAVRGGVSTVRKGVAAAGAAQVQADKLRLAQDEVVARSAAGAVKTAVRAVRPGSPADPGPGRLATEWATGRGPETRVLGPESSFSQEFVEAPSVRGYLREYLGDWRQREGGVAGVYRNPPDRRARFGLTEFMDDLAAGNGASHFVGTWGVRGERRGDRIGWAAENDTDTTSFFYGRPLREAGLPHVPAYPRRTPRPGGRTHQTIQFSTDLDGRPLLPRR